MEEQIIADIRIECRRAMQPTGPHIGIVAIAEWLPAGSDTPIRVDSEGAWCTKQDDEFLRMARAQYDSVVDAFRAGLGLPEARNAMVPSFGTVMRQCGLGHFLVQNAPTTSARRPRKSRRV